MNPSNAENEENNYFISKTQVSIFTTVPEDRSSSKFLLGGKRHNFKKEIRRQFINQQLQSRRSQFTEFIQSENFFSQLAEVQEKGNNLDDLKLNEVILKLKKEFSRFNISEQKRAEFLKSFIMRVIDEKMKILSLAEKTLIVQCLIYLTYFQIEILSFPDTQMLIEVMVSEVRKLQSFEQIPSEEDKNATFKYLSKIVDFFLNASSGRDREVHNSILQSKVYNQILDKVRSFMSPDFLEVLQNRVNNPHIPFECQRFEEDRNRISELRASVLDLGRNLSEVDSKEKLLLFEIISHEFMTDITYMAINPRQTVRILTHFFDDDNISGILPENCLFCEWYEELMGSVQKLYPANSSSKQISKEIDPQSASIFYELLGNLIYLFESLIFDENSIKSLIYNGFSPFYLSEFLIQFSLQDQGSGKHKRYVERAIEVFEHLAQNQEISIEELLLVTNRRTLDDIFTVLLKEPYFTSIRLSAITLSLLNLILIRSPAEVYELLFEGNVYQSICRFLEQSASQVSETQMVEFLHFLKLLIQSCEEFEGKSSDSADKGLPKKCEGLKMFEAGNWLEEIFKYQDLESKKVSSMIEELKHLVLGQSSGHQI